jgi:hypothetical protein
MPDILGLLIHLFSLAGNDVLFPAIEQSHLLDALKLALYEDRELLQGKLSELGNHKALVELYLAKKDFQAYKIRIFGDICFELHLVLKVIWL